MPRPPPQHMVTSARWLPDALELVHRLGEQDGAGPAERVPERDGPAVRVDLRHVGAGGALPAEHHRRERLVDLHEVDVVDGELVALEQVLGGGDGAGRA